MTEHTEQRVKELFVAVPEAVVLMSMGIVPREDDPSHYKTTSYADADDHGYLGGGEATVRAGAVLYRVFPSAVYVTDSYGAGKRDIEPTHAAVMAAELHTLGVPKEQILLEEESIDTATELIELMKLADKYGWSRVAVITNDYHMERTKVMYEYLGTYFGSTDDAFMDAFRRFTERNGQVEFVETEAVLLAEDPDYQRVVDEVHRSDAYRTRLASEHQGIDHIRSGIYGRVTTS